MKPPKITKKTDLWLNGPPFVSLPYILVGIAIPTFLSATAFWSILRRGVPSWLHLGIRWNLIGPKLSLMAAFFLGLFSLLFLTGALWLTLVLLFYAFTWGYTSLKYKDGQKWAYLASIMLTTPWALLFGIQLCSRLVRAIRFFAFKGGIDLGFPQSWALETPPTLGMLLLIVFLILDWKRVMNRNTKHVVEAGCKEML